MSDDPSIATPTLEVPLLSYVKGGTTTSAGDALVAATEADAERRRNEAAVERQMTLLPTEEGGGKIFANETLQFGGPALDGAHVLLHYYTRGGELAYLIGQPMTCLADIRVVDGSELALVLVCPRCMNNGAHHDHAQLQIRQSNRMWHLDRKSAGEPFQFGGQVYISVGTVCDSDRFSCPTCGWSAKIHDNKVRPVP